MSRPTCRREPQLLLSILLDIETNRGKIKSKREGEIKRQIEISFHMK